MSEQNGAEGNGAAPEKPTGRPRKRLTAEDIQQVQRWAAQGYPEHAIAAKLGMSHDTFTRRKAEQRTLLRALELGSKVADGKVARALFLSATGLPVAVPLRDEKGNIRTDPETGEVLMTVGYRRGPKLGAVIWWEKTRAGRRDPTYASGGKTGEGEEAPDGSPVIPLETLRAAVKRAEARQGLELVKGNGNGRKHA